MYKLWDKFWQLIFNNKTISASIATASSFRINYELYGWGYDMAPILAIQGLAILWTIIVMSIMLERLVNEVEEDADSS